MLKGYQRRLIMMPTKDSPHFEAAYFILRKEAEHKTVRPNEMLCEATRILQESSPKAPRPPLRFRHLAIAFAVGLAVGLALLGTVWLAVAIAS